MTNEEVKAEPNYVDGIHIKDVHYVERKITDTLFRLNRCRAWSTQFYLGLKTTIVIKLQKQLKFLLDVRKKKYPDEKYWICR